MTRHSTAFEVERPVPADAHCHDLPTHNKSGASAISSLAARAWKKIQFSQGG